MSHGDCSRCDAELVNGQGLCDTCVGDHTSSAFKVGMQRGAAVAFGLVGMALAIRKNAPRLVTREYWTRVDGKLLYTCFCPGCGCQMKNRVAGEDEGTIYEWCGACRY